MNVKDCYLVLEKAEAMKDRPPEVMAWIGRLSDELSSGFCVDRSCSECPVYLLRVSSQAVELTSREMVVGVVSGALIERLGIGITESRVA